ncbi:MAG: carbon-nitrogen hydrolase family protein [Gammaproteobacteria bacterium]|nr:carbon-nitrogen hydrolase family protein [Gammaproteobacteria bacterium]
MNPRVAGIQMTSTSDVKENLEMAKKLIQQAVDLGAKLIVLPEMFALMGMGPMDKINLREELGHGLIQDFLQTEAKKHRIWLVGGTIPIAIAKDDSRARAACLVFDDQGECVARYDKVHLFDVHLRASQEDYSESKTIEAGDKVVVVQTPFGRLGLGVCYDIRFPELFRRMQAQDVEIIALPTAFTYTTGAAHWDVLIRARAIENLAYLVTSCQTGTHTNGRKTYGHTMIVNPWGTVDALLEEGAGVVVGDINLEYMRQLRQDFPVLLHRKL